MNLSKDELQVLHTCVLDAIAFVYKTTKSDTQYSRERVALLENLERKILLERSK